MERETAENIISDLDELSADGPHDSTGVGIYEAEIIEEERELYAGGTTTERWVKVLLYARYYESPAYYRDEFQWNASIPFELMDYAVRKGFCIRLRNVSYDRHYRLEVSLKEPQEGQLERKREAVDEVTYVSRAT